MRKVRLVFRHLSQLMLFVGHDDIQQFWVLAVFDQIDGKPVSYFPESSVSYFLWRYFFNR
jgi:hypothetical protein